MQTLPEALLAQISDAIAAQIGLYFPPERLRDLERCICSAAHELGKGTGDDLHACAQHLASGPLTAEQIDTLARYLTVGETYFFRGKETFDALRSHVLPELIRSRRNRQHRLRIWSAACATGEEPYSIAILLNQVLADWNDWQVTLLATDINSDFLQRAAAGVYRDWSFRGIPPSLKEQYFYEEVPGHFALRPSIKKRVQFDSLNLAAGNYPSPINGTEAMDVIFCRNVLMYFAPDQVNRVLDRLDACLVEGGWLVLSPGEVTPSLAARFDTVEFPGTILYRKKPHTSTRSVVPAQHIAQVDSTNDRTFSGAPITHANMEAPPRPAPQPDIQTHANLTRSNALQNAVAPDASGDHAIVEEMARQNPETRPAAAGAPPTEAKALIERARIHADRRQHGEALAWCERAIAADKLNPIGYYLRAAIHQEQGQTEAAARALKHAIYLDPDFIMAHFALGNLALRQGHLRQANKHFANTLELLDEYPPDEIVAESHGLTAARLAQMIRTARNSKRAG